MNARDYRWLAALLLVALFIWTRDATWLGRADASWPVLISLPLFVWFGFPWKFNTTGEPIALKRAGLGVACLALGVLTNLVTLLAAGWTLLLWTWLSARVEPDRLPHVRRLLVLPMLAFPCVICDGEHIGWLFRISGAFFAQGFFSLVGFDVSRVGADLTVNGAQISIAPACAGLNTLQAMLIAGSAAAILIMGSRARWWWTLPLLGVIAWMSNTLRIILIGISALTFGPQFTMGAFHAYGGWLVLTIMFATSVWLFSVAQRFMTRSPR